MKNRYDKFVYTSPDQIIWDSQIRESLQKINPDDELTRFVVLLHENGGFLTHGELNQKWTAEEDVRVVADRLKELKVIKGVSGSEGDEEYRLTGTGQMVAEKLIKSQP